VKLSLNENDLANLILQRTGPFLKAGGGPALRNWFKTGDKKPLTQVLIEHGNVEYFINAAFAEVEAEFTALKQHIVTSAAKTVTSIGPGAGFFELLVYQALSPQLVLIDIEQSDAHDHGFAQESAGYSSLASLRSFLMDNGVAAAHIETCNPRLQPLPTASFDVLTSLYSMGFHYPCDEYKTFIRDGLRPGGLLILDRLNGTIDNGWNELQSAFDVIEQITFPKSLRLVLAKK